MIATLYDRLLSGLVVLAGGLVLFFMTAVSVDVVGRYFLGKPIGWVLEYCEHGLLYLTFLGMPWLARRQGHIRIDVAVQALRGRAKAGLGVVIAAACALICGVAAYWAALTTWDHFQRGILTVGIYPIPKFLVMLPIAVGFGLTAMEYLKQVIVEAQHWGADPRA